MIVVKYKIARRPKVNVEQIYRGVLGEPRIYIKWRSCWLLRRRRFWMATYKKCEENKTYIY